MAQLALTVAFATYLWDELPYMSALETGMSYSHPCARDTAKHYILSRFLGALLIIESTLKSSYRIHQLKLRHIPSQHIRVGFHTYLCSF